MRGCLWVFVVEPVELVSVICVGLVGDVGWWGLGFWLGWVFVLFCGFCGCGTGRVGWCCVFGVCGGVSVFWLGFGWGLGCWRLDLSLLLDIVLYGISDSHIR